MVWRLLPPHPILRVSTLHLDVCMNREKKEAGEGVGAGERRG
jgi:hypothetical protein